MKTKPLKKFTWVYIYIYHLLDFKKKNIWKKKFKIGNKGNRNEIFIFWKIKDQKKWKKRGETKENKIRTNIRKETK